MSRTIVRAHLVVIAEDDRGIKTISSPRGAVRVTHPALDRCWKDYVRAYEQVQTEAGALAPDNAMLAQLAGLAPATGTMETPSQEENA